jgi:uncharacterized LabA/DUF88 family protein
MKDTSSTAALFIDGANLHLTAKALAFEIDYRKLLAEFQSRASVLWAFFYAAVIEGQEYSSIRPLLSWLGYNGFTVISKPVKELVDATGRRKTRASMRIEIAADAIRLAAHLDQMVLFSGNGDFRPLIKAVQRQGVRVSVVSSVCTHPPMIADALRHQADAFIDLVELKTVIGRPPAERSPK